MLVYFSLRDSNIISSLKRKSVKEKGNNAFAELQDEVVCKVFVIFLNYLFFTSWLTSAKKLNQNLSLDWNPEVELAVKQGETAGSMNASEGWKAS